MAINDNEATLKITIDWLIDWLSNIIFQFSHYWAIPERQTSSDK